MNIQRVNRNSGSVSPFKITGIVLVIFIVGLVSGITLLQLTPSNNNIDLNDINLTEDLKIEKCEIWVINDLTYSQAGILLVNEENVPTKITEITIKGIECPWSNVYFWKTNIFSVEGDFEPCSNDLSGSTVSIDVEGEEQVFQQATQDIILESFQAMVLYLKEPVDISQPDVPNIVTLAVFTEKSMFSEEISLAPTTIGFIGSAELYKANVNFVDESGVKKITIDIGNSGISNTRIVGTYVGTSASTTQSLSTTPATPISLSAGSIVSFNVTYTWSAGETYYFRVVPEDGQLTLTFQEQTPQ